MGISYVINLVDGNPTEEQAVLFEQLIRSLCDLPAEFLVFEFRNAKNGPGVQEGLVFFQLCREGNDIHAEIRIDRPDGMRMYAKRITETETIRLLRRMIRTRTAPETAGWEDITEQVLAGPGDEAFE